MKNHRFIKLIAFFIFFHCFNCRVSLSIRRKQAFPTDKTENSRVEHMAMSGKLRRQQRKRRDGYVEEEKESKKVKKKIKI
jgi:hypothetical protein